jgi:hypothetical protein
MMTWRPELGSSSPHAVLQKQHPWLQQRLLQSIQQE